MFFGREIIEQNVMLWTETKTSTDFLNVMPNVEPINECRSTCRREKPCIIQQTLYHKSTSNAQTMLLTVSINNALYNDVDSSV